MKKIFLCTSLFLVLKANGQSIQLGVDAGTCYNFAHQESLVGFPYVAKASGRQFSYRAGVPVVIPASASLRLNTGLYYTTKGLNHSQYDVPFLQYSLIELPLILTWNHADDQRNSFFIGAGPYVGYGISSTIRWTVSGEKKQEHPEWSTDIKRLDLGAQVQLGYEFSSGWTIRLLAQRGLNNLGVKATNDNFKRYQAFSQVNSNGYLALTVGYLLRFNHR